MTEPFGSRAPSFASTLWLIAILTTIGVGAGFVVTKTQSEELSDPLPSSPPEESRRSGLDLPFSIVVPDGWEARATWGGELHLFARKSGSERASRVVMIMKYPDWYTGVEREEATIVRGQNFVWRMLRETSSRTTYWRGQMLVGETWFSISWTVDGEHDEVPERVLQYLETLRVEDAATADPEP